MKTLLSSALLASILLLSACGGKKTDDITAKKEELKKLRTEQSKLNAKIRTLESQIQSLNVDKDKMIPVMVTTLTKKEFNHYVEAQGVVDSDKNVKVASETGGAIKKIYVKEGQYVTAGKVLAKLDDVLIRKGMAELEQSMEFVKINYEKQTKLWAQKIGTEIEYLSIKNQYESLEKKKESLQEQLEKTNIKAPINGVVDDIIANEGEIAAPGVPMLRIVDGKDVKIIADIAETYSASVQKGTNATVKFPALGKTFVTPITNIGEVINPSDRSFKVELALSNPEKLYKPNMLATVQVKDYAKKEAVVIPRNAIMRGETDEFVFVVQNGVAKKTIIKTGLTYQGETEVLSGLNGNEQLITVGFQDLSDGQKVEVK